MRPTTLLALAAASGIATAFVSVPAADAQSRQRVVVSEPSGPKFNARRARTRITVQPRSFLDLGTEVMPGDRKYMDYALPPNYSVTSVIDNRAGIQRSPLPGPFDLPDKRNPASW